MVQNGYKVASGNSTKDHPNWEIYSNKKLLFARKESLYDKIMLISELLHCLEDLLRWNQKLRYKRFVYITFWKKWMCALKLLQVGGFSFSQIRWLKTHCCQSDTLMFNCKLSLNFFFFKQLVCKHEEFNRELKTIYKVFVSEWKYRPDNVMWSDNCKYTIHKAYLLVYLNMNL